MRCRPRRNHRRRNCPPSWSSNRRGRQRAHVHLAPVRPHRRQAAVVRPSAHHRTPIHRRARARARRPRQAPSAATSRPAAAPARRPTRRCARRRNRSAWSPPTASSTRARPPFRRRCAMSPACSPTPTARTRAATIRASAARTRISISTALAWRTPTTSTNGGRSRTRWSVSRSCAAPHPCSTATPRPPAC